MSANTTKEPELEYGDYIRYERGTAPLDAKNNWHRNRDDYKRRFQNKTAEEKHLEERRKLFEKQPSPINEKQAKEEAMSDSTETKDRKEIPFVLQFRSIEPSDFNFILNAWMRSYRDSKRDHTNTDYYHGQQNLIAAISQRRTMIIGCDAEAPEWMAGFICGQKLKDGRLLVDYVYVKHAYRERGIARALLDALGYNRDFEIIATHWTKQVDKVGRRYGATHNSYFNSMGFSDV
ncbi:MAG: N-acetyltransferase [Cytophagaceae bacterium]|nr:MAG: N-acetyltransferase [Cytophagaceae bacterium]